MTNTKKYVFLFKIVLFLVNYHECYFFLKLLFMDSIHYYIYIYRNISELFDCSVFKRQLSKDFVGMSFSFLQDVIKRKECYFVFIEFEY